MFETEHLATLRVDSGHHVLDSAVFSRGVHCLENNEDRVAIGRVVKLLHRAQLLNVLFNEFCVLLLRLVYRIDQGWPLLEIDAISFPDTKITRFDLHLRSFSFLPTLIWRSALSESLLAPSPNPERLECPGARVPRKVYGLVVRAATTHRSLPRRGFRAATRSSFQHSGRPWSQAALPFWLPAAVALVPQVSAQLWTTGLVSALVPRGGSALT